MEQECKAYTNPAISELFDIEELRVYDVYKEAALNLLKI